jgi:hypothetical protein
VPWLAQAIVCGVSLVLGDAGSHGSRLRRGRDHPLRARAVPRLRLATAGPGAGVRALRRLAAGLWSELPLDHRPKLLLFGKSLGTAGVEAPFAAVDAGSSITSLTARTDGALVVGAKHGNTILSQLTDERDPGPPVWQPVFDGGSTVRFLSRDVKGWAEVAPPDGRTEADTPRLEEFPDHEDEMESDE